MPVGYDYIAARDLHIGFVLAFTPGQLVPDSTVASQGWVVPGDVLLIGSPIPIGAAAALVVSPETFGAKADGVTDDAAAIQAAINYCNSQGFGWVFLQNRVYLIKSTLVIKEGVTLLGQRNHRTLTGATGSTILADTTLTTGWIIDTAASAIGCGIDGVNVKGQQSGTINVLGGVRINNGTYGVRVANVWCNGVTDSAIGSTGHPVAAIIDNCVIGMNSSGRTLTGPVGALHLLGTDHTVRDVEAARGPSSASGAGSIHGEREVSYAGFWRCGIYVGCATSVFEGSTLGEFADCAWYIDTTAAGNVFTGARADFSAGHGFYVLGTDNQFVGCRVFDAGISSQFGGTAHAYDGVFHGTSAARNKWTNFAYFNITGIPVGRYGWSDTAAATAGNSLWQWNIPELAVVGDTVKVSGLRATHPSGAGPLSQRPPSRHMGGGSWFDTDSGTASFSDGTHWRNAAGTVTGSLDTAAGATGQDGTNGVHWVPFTGCTTAGAFYWNGTTPAKLLGRQVYAKITATSTGATNGYMETDEGSSNFVTGVTPGVSYTVGVQTTADTQPATVTISCRWRNSGGSVIQTDAGAVTGGGTNSTTALTDSYLQGCLAPAGASTLDVIVRFTRAGMAAGEVHNISSRYVVPGAVVGYSHP